MPLERERERERGREIIAEANPYGDVNCDDEVGFLQQASVVWQLPRLGQSTAFASASKTLKQTLSSSIPRNAKLLENSQGYSG